MRKKKQRKFNFAFREREGEIYSLINRGEIDGLVVLFVFLLLFNTNHYFIMKKM